MATALWSAAKNAKLGSPTAGFGVDVQSLHRTADLGSLMATFETLVSQLEATNSGRFMTTCLGCVEDL